jgi:signal transduction histidine kinase
VRIDIPDARFPAFAESTAYCVAREGLANVVTHAKASTARVAATDRPDRLLLVVEDDGVGGATPSPGSGLAGLADRTAAFGGTLIVDSPPGAGTRLRATIPLRAPGLA